MIKIETVTMNAKQAAVYIGLCETTFLQLVRAKRIPVVQIGRRYLFTEQMLNNWLESECSKNIAD